MYTDLFGKTRQKVGTHIHTTVSDGKRTPEESIAMYRAAGYDAIALTDHWQYQSGTECDGLRILSGCEYNFGANDCSKGVFHIVALGCTTDPAPDRALDESPAALLAATNDAIQKITAAGGLAVLAHPAWSLNTPEMIRQLPGVCATEIYNTVSGVHASNRPDSSAIVDLCAAQGLVFPLLAADDVHYYDNDACVSYIMAEAETNDTEAILSAIREGRFYASQGPEIHLLREGDHFKVVCSPVDTILFYSNLAWTAERMHYGDGLTEAIYPLSAGESFLRAEVIDRNGKHAWSNIIRL